MNNNFFDSFPFSSHQMKIFFGTFIAMFIMVSLHYLGVKLPLGMLGGGGN